MTRNIIKVIRTLYENEGEEGLKFRELKNLANIHHTDDFAFILMFLLDINFVKCVVRDKNKYYYIINRTCPLIQKIKQGIYNLDRLEPKDL